MDIISAIKSRKSIRSFLPDPVSQETIRAILEAATRSPSALNTQPWEITVVCGEPLQNIKSENANKLLSGVSPEERASYSGIFRERRIQLAIDIFKLMGIQREDKEKRSDWLLRGFRFFDAPVAIFLSIDETLDEHTMAEFDLGAFTQTICLAAQNYGLATCIELQGIAYPEVVRKYAGIPGDKKLIASIALGYPDMTFPANQLVSQRASVDEVTTWIGF
jgi:nitroreductase